MKKIAAVRDAVDSVWTRISAVGLLVVFLFVFAGCIRQATTSGTTTGQRETGPPASRPVKWPTDDIAVAIRTPDEARAFLARYLEECVLPLWTSPSLVDHKYGGFLNVVDAEGRPVGQKTKPLLAHLRLLFAYAVAIQRARSPAERADLRSRFDAGMRYLGTRFRDPRDGGWFFALGVDGRPVSSDKPVLGQYYAVYILAEIARMLGHSGAARLARETFDRIEPRAHDAVYGGYLNDWTLPPEAATNAVKSTGLNFHVLLALAALHRIDPRPAETKRIRELLRLAKTRFVYAPSGNVWISLHRDWRPLHMPPGSGDLTLYGHNAELVWYCMEAQDVLGMPFDVNGEWLRSVAGAVVRYGWTPEGALQAMGLVSGPVTCTEVHYWNQAEAMILFIRMYEVTGNKRWWRCFQRTTAWTFRHVARPGRRPWRLVVRPDGTPLRKTFPGAEWRAGFHVTRMLLECDRTLHRLSGAKGRLLQGCSRVEARE